MPRLQFYAVGLDVDQILQFIYEELDCRVFESYSEPDADLLEFSSLDSFKQRFPEDFCQREGQAILQLWPVNAYKHAEVLIEKFDLNPVACDGATYRHKLSGWGLIQLHFGGLGQSGASNSGIKEVIVESYTNHNSEKRAQKWGETYDEKVHGRVSDWDFREVNSQSRKLNYYIRKLAVEKVRGATGDPVLPEAAQARRDGAKIMIGHTAH